jgi:hypothetical protein
MSEQLAQAVKTLSSPAPVSGLSFAVPKILLEGDEAAEPPISGPGRKFALGASGAGGKTDPIEQRMPEIFGSGKLTMTARDPRCLYVYWDLNAEQQRQYNEASGQPHLRVHLHNAFGPVVSETAVHAESRHWFLHVPHAAATYVTELGFYLPGHEWIGIATSVPVTTPPETSSADRTVRFAELPPEKPAESLPGEPRSFYHRSESPPLPALVGWRPEQPQLQFPQPPAESATFSAEWSAAQEQALEEIMSLSIVRHEWFDSFQLVEMLESRRAGRQLFPIRPHLERPELNFPAPSSAELIPQAQEIESVSSPFGLEEKPRRRDFWFNVNAELIVYGATEPSARVTIGGRPIKLRPDGTFSYRFALPDGNYELPAAATSVDDDTRRAELKFSRGTTYQGDVGQHPQDNSLKIPAPENVA